MASAKKIYAAGVYAAAVYAAGVFRGIGITVTPPPVEIIHLHWTAPYHLLHWTVPNEDDWV